MSENRPLAIMLFLLAGMAIAAMTGVVRVYSPHLPVGQIMFWRSLTAIPVIILYMIVRREFPRALHTRRLPTHLLRMIIAVLAMACSFASLAYLSVAMSMAIGFLAPVLVLLLASLFLGERLTGMRIVAALLGLAGVGVVLLRALHLPQEGALIGTVLALAFAGLMAVARVVVKDLTRTDRPATVAIYFAIGGTAAGAATAFWGWQPLSAQALAGLSCAGLFGALAHILAAEGLARAPVSVLAPIEYTQLIWAVLIDLLVFRIVPGPLGLLGMGIITASGLLIWVEGRRGRGLT